MTPGDIDLKIVHDRLRIVAECLNGLRNLPAKDLQEFQSDARNPAAADSYLRRAIEALFDTTRHILSKKFGLGALQYREVAHQAEEQGLIGDAAEAQRFRQIAGYRNRLAHFYDRVTPEELFEIVQNRLDDLETLAERLRAAATRDPGE